MSSKSPKTEDLFKGARDEHGRWLSWHERWSRGLLSPEEVTAVERVASEGLHGEIVTWRGNVEYTKWPAGDTTTVTKQWYLDHIYQRSDAMKEEQALDALDRFCTDLKDILADADLEDADGRADLVRDLGIRIENIEGRVQELRELKEARDGQR